MDEMPSSDKHETRITAIVVLPKGEDLFSETSTTIEIRDEAAGEFLRVSQVDGHVANEKHLLLDPDEWPVVRAAIDMMIGLCRAGQ